MKCKWVRFSVRGLLAFVFAFNVGFFVGVSARQATISALTAEVFRLRRDLDAALCKAEAAELSLSHERLRLRARGAEAMLVEAQRCIAEAKSSAHGSGKTEIDPNGT